MPTRSVRTGITFGLQVSLVESHPGAGCAASDIQQVLGSLWAWLFLGGIGARTRRGFGALELAAPIRLETAAGVDADGWNRLFAGPEESDVSSWLEDFEQVASPTGGAWPLEIVMGDPRSNAGAAHQEMVDCLKTFRQAPGVGRDPGNGRPGSSRWPEAHLLRALAPGGAVFIRHPPPRDLVERARSGEVGAPRAAFGLPIQVKFKADEDPAESCSNATLQPVGAKRWPSPLLVRPLRVAGGRYRPVAIFLPFPRPSEVEIEYENGGERKRTCPVASPTGARAQISAYLQPTGGRALEAFADWLVQEKRCQRVSLARRP